VDKALKRLTYARDRDLLERARKHWNGESHR
jgi:hypothetical protein